MENRFVIGFYGGSFDPIHLGHTHLAQTLSEKYRFTRFLFCPNYQNPMKGSPHASPTDRLEMLQSSLKELANPLFQIFDFETRQNKPCYTIDTIRELKKQTPEDIILILGSETFQEIDKWRDPVGLLSLVDLLVISRGKSDVSIPNTLENIGIKTIRCVENGYWSHSNERRRVKLENVNALPYSSTELRREISEYWKNSHTMEPPKGIQRSVWLLIKEKRLYAVTKG